MQLKLQLDMVIDDATPTGCHKQLIRLWILCRIISVFSIRHAMARRCICNHGEFSERYFIFVIIVQIS